MFFALEMFAAILLVGCLIYGLVHFAWVGFKHTYGKEKS